MLVGQSSPIVQKETTNLVGQSSSIVQKTISHGQSGTIDLPHNKDSFLCQSGTIDLPEKNNSAGLSGTIDIPEKDFSSISIITYSNKFIYIS